LWIANMVCSFWVYWLYYKILFSLAYPCFSCCFVNCDDCTTYMSRYKCRCRSMWKSVDFILEIWFFLLNSLYVKQYTFLGCYNRTNFGHSNILLRWCACISQTLIILKYMLQWWSHTLDIFHNRLFLYIIFYQLNFIKI